VADSVRRRSCRQVYGLRGQCGLARPRVLAGESPAWVIVRHEPSIEPCGVAGNRYVDA
jgi:hypothetical protein